MLSYHSKQNTKEDIQEIQAQVDLPIIGIVKRDYADSKVYITPTMKEIEELMEVKPEIIAMDATIATRPGQKSLKEFFEEVKKRYPEQLFMADCSTVEEAVYADESPTFEDDIDCAHFACVHGEPAKSGEVISTKKR